MSVQRNNRVKLTGTIQTGLEFSHDLRGERFYKTTVEVSRLSEESDILVVLVSEDIINPEMDYVGQTVCVKGSYRSFNRPVEDRTKLELFVFANNFDLVDTLEDGETNNSVYLNGFICKPPVFRKTPKGRLITDIMVAVNRNYDKSDYIPCVCWGENAKKVQDYEVGTEITLSGRIQSRTYNKHISEDVVESRVAYEVSVAKISKVENIETNDESVNETNTDGKVPEQEVITTTEPVTAEE